MISPALYAATLYLPLNDPLMPHAERMLSLSPQTIHKKPYSLSLLQNQAQKIAKQYPQLSHLILSQLQQRYGRSYQLNQTQVAIKISSTDKAELLPYQQGELIGTGLQLKLTASAQPYSWLKGQLRYRAQSQPNQQGGQLQTAYLSLGTQWLQLDAGLRSHWLSSSPLNSPLFSNLAQNTPSLTLSNPQPWTQLGITFEAFLTQLDSQAGIRLNNTLSAGQPYVIGTQLAFQLIPEWSLALNRTFMFGGGDRTVGFKDFVEAFINPTGKDNVGLSNCTGSSPNCEFGNQQMLVESRFKSHIDTQPLDIIVQVGAEDTERGSMTKIGNVFWGLEVGLPELFTHHAFRLRYEEWEAGWYVHHIYSEGYRNNGVILGNYWAQLQQNLVGKPGNQATLSWQTFQGLQNFQAIVRYLTTYDFPNTHKKTYHLLNAELGIHHIQWQKLPFNLRLYASETLSRQTWFMLSLGVSF